MRIPRLCLIVPYCLLLLVPAQSGLTQSKVEKNVVYGMYSGLALLLDVYYPDKPNGYGIIHVSGSGFTRPLSLDAKRITESPHVEIEGKALVGAGYTLFTVNHRAIPRFLYPAAVEDVQRAVRFIRYHARKYGINPDRIGAVGGSSGGYLVSMLGVLDGEGDPEDESPINQLSAKVQCVIARATPATLLEGTNGAAFLGFRLGEKTEPKSIEYKRAREASPVTHVTPDDPPFLLLHGDKDMTVPFKNSEMMAEALQLARVPFKLIRVEGAGHGPRFTGAVNPPDLDRERVQWMDTHLRKE